MKSFDFKPFFLLLLFFGLSSTITTYGQENERSFAQNFNYHSPTAFAFSKVGNVPTNPFTGQLKLNLPLLEKKMSVLDFKMGLSYTGGGGIKVNEPRLITGKAWLLNTGGIIIRNKRGVPDDYGNAREYGGSIPAKYNGILFNNGVSYSSDGEKGIAFVDNAFAYSEGTADAQHDIFEFNFFGTAGKFYIGKNQEIKIVTDSKIKIIPTYNSTVPEFSIGSFLIIDEAGVKYYFSSIEYTKDGDLTIYDEDNIKYYGKWYPSSWLLTKIESPFDEETILYEYVQRSGLGNVALSPTAYSKRSDQEVGMLGTGGISRNTKELQIKSISFSDGAKIEFKYFSKLDEEDFPLLKGIEMLNNGSEVIKAYLFNYKAWIGNTEPFYTSVCPNLCPALFNYNYYLKDVKELGENGQTQLAYEFDYSLSENHNEASLSSQNGIDWWGYYNGKQNETLFPVATQWSATPADRTPSLEFAQVGSLKRIIYGTGGSEEFVYELNDKRGANGNIIIGGIRLGKRILHSGSVLDEEIIKEYRYIEADGLSSGFLGETPEHTFIYNVYHNDGGWPNNPNLKRFTTNTFSFPVNPLSSIEGSYVGYRRVEEHFQNSNSNLGKIVYEYTDLTSLNFWHPSDYYPYRPVDRPYWAVGLPTKTTYFTSDGLPVKESINEYQIIEENNQTDNFRSLHIEKSGEIDVVGGTGNELRFIYKFTNYYPVTGRAELTGTHEHTYSSTLPQTKTTTSSLRTYDPTFFKLRSASAVDSKGGVTKKTFYYPFDFTLGAESFTHRLVQANILNAPVLTETWLNKATGSYLVNSEVTEYGLLDNSYIIRPSVLYTSNLTQPLFSSTPDAFNPSVLLPSGRNYKIDATFTNYDETGRLHEIKKQGDFVTSIILDKSGNIIAKGDNVRFNDFAFSNFEEEETGNWTYTESGVSNSDSKVGKRSFNGSISKSNLNTGNYVLSFWAKGTNDIQINTFSQDVDNQWKFYKVELSNVNSISISTSGSLIDEVLLYRQGGNITALNYDNGVGITSVMDNNGKNSFYEYDNFNRLKNIKDFNGDIIKSYAYHFIDPVFKNVSVSRTFEYGNGCVEGTTPGSPITYTVPEGKYTSYISQADADANAISDINTNGQRYADDNGGCIAIFYNAAVSAPFSKNNCPQGTVTFPVYYYVAAETHSSLVSQADADSKAQDDIIANGQNYANTNGICRQIIEVNLWNSTQTTFKISFSGLGTQFDYPPGSSKLQIPQGSYTVHIEDPASGTYTYWIGSRSSIVGPSANFSNVNISAGSDDRNVNATN